MAGKRFALCGVLTLMVPVLLYAQRDSLVLPEVLITAGLPQYRNTQGEVRYQADSLGRFGTAGLDLSSLLAQTEGLYLRDYGGHGGVRTLSFRGFAADQTQLLVDGLPLRSPQSGVANLGPLYLAGFGEVAIQPQADALASNPGGGVLALGTRAGSWRPWVQALGGSWGQWGLSGSAAKPLGPITAQGTLQYLSAQDDYPFAINSETGRRPPVDYHLWRTVAGLDWQSQPENESAADIPIPQESSAMAAPVPPQPKPRHQLRYRAMGFGTQSLIPAPILTGNLADGLAEKIAQQNWVQYVRHTFHLPSGSVRSQSQLSHALLQQYDHLAYDSPTLGRQVYTLHEALAQAEAEINRNRLRASGQWQAIVNRLAGNNLAKQIGPQTQEALSSVQRPEFHLAGSLAYSLYKSLGPERNVPQVAASFRANWVQGFVPQPNATLRADVPLGPTGLRWLGYGSLSTRVPSFNELYFAGFGRSDLGPERTRQLSSGLAWGHAQGRNRWLLRAMGYGQSTDNKLVSVPLSPVRWSTLQLGRTVGQGFELAGEWAWADWLRASLAYTRLWARDRSLTAGAWLPYTPPELAQASLWLGRAHWGGFLSWQYVGWRYTGLQNDPATVLPAYALLDASISWNCPFAIRSPSHTAMLLELRLACQNVLDARYAVIASYPMPPRRFRLEATWYF